MESKTIVRTQQDAAMAVKAIALSHGQERVFWGTGSPIDVPHVKAVQRYFDITVTWYPQGEGYGRPATFYSISIRN